MMNKTPIAVTGMAGIFPGAPDVSAFWNNIQAGIGAVTEVPRHRWICQPDRMVSKKIEADRTLSKRAGLIRDFSFDMSDLSLDRDLILQLDPMYHLVLSAGRDALRDCRLSPGMKKRTGVILAAIALPTDASSFLTREILGRTFEASLFGPGIFDKKAPLSRGRCLSSRVTSLPAAIVAKALGLNGGSYTLDAACSSSLYSIKLACDELHSRRADLMLAGGVSRPESLFTQAGFTQLKALSPSGICAPFDADADGLVVGEGAGFIVLKRLDDALKDKDRIYALIHGSGLSNDIGGNLLAPDSEGQIRAMSLAYADAGWSPYDVDHIECHGTGTPVGDTIELKSMKAVWGDDGWNKGQCAIGSVKSMIGHLLTGAGIAGTIKTLLALNHKILPPSLNFKKPSKGSPLEDGPFRVLSHGEEWPRRKDNPRRAAMSAFGFGGINAHILVEDYENDYSKTYAVPASSIPCLDQPLQVAVVGMGVFLGPARTLDDFQTSVLSGLPFPKSPAGENRFRGTEAVAERYRNGEKLPHGSYINEFAVSIGEFHIPPNEIPDILPQHLLMLKAAGQAMDDAGLPRREDRPRMGAAIGMAFDYEAANFHIRWNLENQVEKWNDEKGLGLDEQEKHQWLDALKDAIHPPLSSARTTGALGGIIASRVAKEFRLGGPSFIVSCEEASGLKALEIGARSIQNGETDLYLVGAVDLPGEIRNLLVTEKLKSVTGSPCEGSVALVLKRLDKAIQDKDRIYALVTGFGKSCDGGIDEASASEEACRMSLENVFKDSGVSPADIQGVELQGCGNPTEQKNELAALTRFFSAHRSQTADQKLISLGSLAQITGHTGSVQGLASVVKSALCLYQNAVPVCVDNAAFTDVSNVSLFKTPSETSMGIGDEKPGHTLVSSMTSDGNVSHVILKQYDFSLKNTSRGHFEAGSLLPLGPRNKPEPIRPSREISVIVGGKALRGPALPAKRAAEIQRAVPAPVRPVEQVAENPSFSEQRVTATAVSRIGNGENKTLDLINHVIGAYTLNNEKTAKAHSRFLEFSQSMVKSFAESLNLQSELIGQALDTLSPGQLNAFCLDDDMTTACLQPEELFYEQVKTLSVDLTNDAPGQFEPPVLHRSSLMSSSGARPEPAYPREMCMEFAIGSLGKVLGPEFDIVDTYPVRVRLPDEPLMLVDRIMSVEGVKGSLKSGKVVTEHDVLPGAWYLDGGRCPVCISIEAGQADLFLCSYLGIDLAVKGKRSYRLLDAVAKFHGGLPKPGDTIRYHIEIDRFINQGETYLFFFQFNGYIGDRHIISMRKGCAGFFTEKEVKDSGGIILTADETAKKPGTLTPSWKDLVPFFGTGQTYSLNDDQVNALRKGDLSSAFGPLFKGKILSKALAIPGGRMKLVDRVLSIDPQGGRYGLGSIRAQADIHPDDWFLTCHFVDDKVMPGTLMYECCMHTLRILTMRMGWVTDKTDVCCEPVPEIDSILKCRGPVTVKTKQVFYVVDIKEIGYMPEPYIIADAHMYAQDQHIVMFRDMSMKLTGVTQQDIERYWGE